jgi:hypothetical protein
MILPGDLALTCRHGVHGVHGKRHWFSPDGGRATAPVTRADGLTMTISWLVICDECLMLAGGVEGVITLMTQEHVCTGAEKLSDNRASLH